MNSIAGNGTNGQRLTQSELDELWRDYYRAWDKADAAENAGKPWQPELERYAEEKEQVYMAAQYTAGIGVTQ